MPSGGPLASQAIVVWIMLMMGLRGAYEVYDGAGFLLSVQPEKAGVQFL